MPNTRARHGDPPDRPGRTRASIQDIATGTPRTFPSVAALCA